VSYASPAYYADRLCDRGRHYLRDLFHHTNAGKPHRDVQNKKRQELERRLKQDRIKKYGSEWQNGKKRTKNKEEISQQEKDKRQVYEEISEDAMKIAKRMFYGSSGKERNPFDDRVSKTMFWM
jgi:eukaryotic translation initiation factor 2C